MKKILLFLCGFFLIYSNSGHPVNIPSMVFETAFQTIYVDKPIERLAIDVHGKLQKIKKPNNLMQKIQDSMKNRKPKYDGFRSYKLFPNSSKTSSALQKISLQQWKDGIYLYPYIVNGLGNIIKDPSTLNKSNIGSLFIAAYDNDMNLLLNEQVSQNISSDFLDFNVQQLLLFINGRYILSTLLGPKYSEPTVMKYGYPFRLGTMILIKAGIGITKPNPTKFNAKDLKLPIKKPAIQSSSQQKATPVKTQNYF